MSTGQHITLAGLYHIAENCDVEDVTIYNERICDHGVPILSWCSACECDYEHLVLVRGNDEHTNT